MKSLLATILITTLSAGMAQARAQRSGEVVLNINTVHIPSGFEGTEPVAILGGIFPNSCYSWNRATVKHVSESVHEVQAVADVRTGMCLMVLIPYSEEVEIGKLTPGKHTLRFLNGDGTYQEKQINID